MGQESMRLTLMMVAQLLGSADELLARGEVKAARARLRQMRELLDGAMGRESSEAPHPRSGWSVIRRRGQNPIDP